MREWTRERIEELLDRGQFSYQRIELPFGLSTTGQDRRSSAELIFPPDLTGKSVLDLGCNHGFFCFEALARGAQRAVGYDQRPGIIRRARVLAEIKGLEPEFEVRDLDRQPPTGSFDYVLCLNALHHFANPLLQLEHMMAMTRGTLVLELAGFSLRDVFRKLEIHWWFALLGFLVTPFPVMFIGRVPGATPDEPQKLKFYFTRRAIRRFFENHAARFPRVEIVDSPFKGRFLLFAHRDPASMSMPAQQPGDTGC